MAEYLSLDLDEIQNTALALSNSVRLSILKLLCKGPRNIKEIAEELDIPLSSTTINVKKLEECNIISSTLKPGIRGSQKICSLNHSKIIIDFNLQEQIEDDDNVVDITMPIGQFVKCSVGPTCGIVGCESPIGLYDEIKTFYLPEKVDAQLIWFGRGYLEYHFPNKLPYGATLDSIEFIAELCSEAPRSNPNWPSDITVWINDQEVGTWTSPGDFADRRGFLTPSWWEPYMTQYGILKYWKVTTESSFIDANPVSNVTIDSLDIQQDPYIKVRIGIKEDAQNKGGMNLFGSQFGNYNQDLILKMRYHYDTE